MLAQSARRRDRACHADERGPRTRTAPCRVRTPHGPVPGTRRTPRRRRPRRTRTVLGRPRGRRGQWPGRRRSRRPGTSGRGSPVRRSPTARGRTVRRTARTPRAGDTTRDRCRTCTPRVRCGWRRRPAARDAPGRSRRHRRPRGNTPSRARRSRRRRRRRTGRPGARRTSVRRGADSWVGRPGAWLAVDRLDGHVTAAETDTQLVDGAAVAAHSAAVGANGDTLLTEVGRRQPLQFPVHRRQPQVTVVGDLLCGPGLVQCREHGKRRVVGQYRQRAGVDTRRASAVTRSVVRVPHTDTSALSRLFHATIHRPDGANGSPSILWVFKYPSGEERAGRRTMRAEPTTPGSGVALARGRVHRVVTTKKQYGGRGPGHTPLAPGGRRVELRACRAGVDTERRVEGAHPRVTGHEQDRSREAEHWRGH